VKCHGYFYEESSFSASTICLVLERCKCSLQDLLDKNEHFNNNTIIDWFLDMAKIVDYFHNGKIGKMKNGILYRDFKDLIKIVF